MVVNVCDNTVANTRCYFPINAGTEVKCPLYIRASNLHIYFGAFILSFINDFRLFYYAVYLHSSLNTFSFLRNNNCLFVIRNFMGICVLNKN